MDALLVGIYLGEWHMVSDSNIDSKNVQECYSRKVKIISLFLFS